MKQHEDGMNQSESTLCDVQFLDQLDNIAAQKGWLYDYQFGSYECDLLHPCGSLAAKAVLNENGLSVIQHSKTTL